MIRAFYDRSDVVTRLSIKTKQFRAKLARSIWLRRISQMVRWIFEKCRDCEKRGFGFQAKRSRFRGNVTLEDADWFLRLLTDGARVATDTRFVLDYYFFLEKKWEKGNEEIEGTEGKQMRFERWDRVLWPDYAGAESSIEERGKEIVAEGK